MIRHHPVRGLGDQMRRMADAALEATVVGSFGRTGFLARRALFDWDAEQPPDLAGRVVVVTGATGGIGLAAAHELAARRAEVWLVGRNAARTEMARRQIVGVTPGALVQTAIADLAVLADVRALAVTLLGAVPRLDVLVHNAGALTHELQYTEDQLEVTAQVQVVAPFLLTAALLPILRAAPAARVVTVSSGGMYAHALDLEALDSPRDPFDGVRAYSNAKRAQVVLNEMWSRQPAAEGVTFHAMHPGWADTPGVQTALPRFRALTRPLLRTPAEGADTIVWLAGAPAALECNGGFWLDRRRRLTSPLPWTRTSPETADALWAWSAEHADLRTDLEAAR